MLKIVRPVSFVLLSAAFCSGGVVHASDRAAITPRVGISQQEGSLKGTVSDSFGPVAGASIAVSTNLPKEIGMTKEGTADIDFYTTRARSLDEVFPWDFIDTGVTKEFLKREWINATKETVTPNCRMRCSGCGVRRFGGGVCYEDQN